MIASILILAAVAVASPCPERIGPMDGHRADVCSEWIHGEPAYSATYAASLAPQPASQQVLVYRSSEGWMIRIAGFRWKPEAEFTTRRNELRISDADARAITTLLATPVVERLAKQPFFGSEDVICTDGASLVLASARDGSRVAASQHSCAGRTEFNRIAASFRELAVKYDPAFADMLDGLSS